jgi:hypothetical protein
VLTALPCLPRFTSKAWVIPRGVLIDLPPAVPKKPITTSPGAVVVTEGATTDLVQAVTAPLCASTGAEAMPLKPRTAPVAGTVDGNDQE